MTTLTQLHNLIKHGQMLMCELEDAQRALRMAETAKGDTFECRALLEDRNFGRERSIEMLPVPKDVVVSACKRAVEKATDRLREAGIDIEPTE